MEHLYEDLKKEYTYAVKTCICAMNHGEFFDLDDVDCLGIFEEKFNKLVGCHQCNNPPFGIGLIELDLSKMFI